MRKRTLRPGEVVPEKAKQIIAEYQLGLDNRVKSIEYRHKVTRSTIRRLWRNREWYLKEATSS